MTEAQQREICSIALLGCDRTTARNYVGATAAQLRGALQGDPMFAQQLLRAEATAEMHHMRNVHHAAKDEKNWRTSVWWLERRAPERFARRDGQGVSAAELDEVVDELADLIVSAIACPEERQRVLDRLRREFSGRFDAAGAGDALQASYATDGQPPTTQAMADDAGEEFHDGDGAAEEGQDGD